jgi:cyclopropane-fatty-acyl-phospholipid synthase
MAHTGICDAGKSENLSERRYPLGSVLTWRDFINPKTRVQHLLEKADIRLDGLRAWDVTVRDERLYGRVLRDGSVGLGESYVDGWWDCSALDEFFCRLLRSGLDRYSTNGWRRVVRFALHHLLNAQTRRRSKEVAERHYNLGNDLYRSMLDGYMVYTCGHWTHASTLGEAQQQKLHAVCERLALEPGMRLLDVGCGWGSLARFAAEKYGAEVVGITISQPQLEFGRQACAGLPVCLYLQDYRDIRERFDRMASLGMFEHVGRKNHRSYFEIIHRSLKPGGLFYLATIGSWKTIREDDPWIQKHIFPNSHLPSWKELTGAIKGLFSIENIEDWAEDYDRTVMAWLRNFEANWANLRSHYDERFHRMWRYYLLAAAATFRAENSASWQILLSPK